MKIIQYNAVSIDGFIARKNGDSDWVSEADEPYFEKAVADSKCIIVGRKTFNQFEDDLYPIKDVLNVVMTSDSSKVKSEGNLLITNKRPDDVITMLEEKGYESALLVGGGKTNYSFLREKLVNEIILSVHPIILGEGIKLFEGDDFRIDLEKTDVRELKDGVVHIYYRVKY